MPISTALPPSTHRARRPQGACRLALAALLLLPIAAVAAPAKPVVGRAAAPRAPSVPATLAPTADAPAMLTVGRVTVDRCGPGVWCGHFPRAFDPAGEVPGTIDIAFQFYRHRDTARPGAGTLVAVEGGPGYPSTGTRWSYLQMLQPLLGDHDLVLMDNRGTGGSQAIDCRPLQTGPGPTAETIGACGRQLGPTSPLYATAYAADDLAALLDALGRSGIDLYGDSYGTWFSQVFAYRHPGLLRSIVLDSAYPVRMGGGESPWYPFFAPTMRQEFDLVCARAAACRVQPGDSLSHIRPALEALRAHPFDAHALDADGREQHFRADASMLALVMLAGAPPFTVARELDAAARAFTAGDTAPLLRLMAEAQAYADPRIGTRPQPYSEGLFWAVSCHDYAQIYDMTLPPAQRRVQRDAVVAARERAYPGTYAPFTIDEFRGMSLDYSLLDACVDWPVPSEAHPPGPPIPPGAALPDVPVLVLSGEIDTITTPPEGALVAASFPHATQVVVANRFHLTALPPQSDPCALGLVRRFIETLDAGDTTCAAQVPPLRTPPAFAPRAADLPLPEALPGNRADAARLRVAAAAVLTLGDGVDRAESNATGRAPGLRGGSVAITHGAQRYRLAFTRVRWTGDVIVDGHLTWPFRPGLAHAHLHVRGPDGVAGTLDVAWQEGVADAEATVTGRLSGQAVVARMPAP